MVYQTDDVYRDLKRRIIEEDLSPGDFLVERDLSVVYSISRTPVREALRQLVADGLVVLNRGRGYSVRQLTIEDLLEIFIAREAVEGTTASLATARMDTNLRGKLERLRTSLETTDASTQTDKAVILGRQLHDTLASAAGNQTLLEFYDKLRNVAALIRNLSRRSIDVEIDSREEHIRIIDSVLGGRREDAERSMRLHLRGTCQRMASAYLRGSTASLGIIDQLTG